jgi:hypothetical protein
MIQAERELFASWGCRIIQNDDVHHLVEPSGIHYIFAYCGAKVSPITSPDFGGNQ